MDKNSHGKYFDLLKEIEKFYKTLDKIYCPCLQETVHFTNYGLIHLFYKKNRKNRKPDEVKNRVEALNKIRLVLESATTIEETRIIENQKGIFTYISFVLDFQNTTESEAVEKVRYKAVIFQQPGSSIKEFCSIMKVER